MPRNRQGTTPPIAGQRRPRRGHRGSRRRHRSRPRNRETTQHRPALRQTWVVGCELSKGPSSVRRGLLGGRPLRARNRAADGALRICAAPGNPDLFRRQSDLGVPAPRRSGGRGDYRPKGHAGRDLAPVAAGPPRRCRDIGRVRRHRQPSLVRRILTFRRTVRRHRSRRRDPRRNHRTPGRRSPRLGGCRPSASGLSRLPELPSRRP